MNEKACWGGERKREREESQRRLTRSSCCPAFYGWPSCVFTENVFNFFLLLLFSRSRRRLKLVLLSRKEVPLRRRRAGGFAWACVCHWFMHDLCRCPLDDARPLRPGCATSENDWMWKVGIKNSFTPWWCKFVKKQILQIVLTGGGFTQTENWEAYIRLGSASFLLPLTMDEELHANEDSSLQRPRRTSGSKCPCVSFECCRFRDEQLLHVERCVQKNRERKHRRMNMCFLFIWTVFGVEKAASQQIWGWMRRILNLTRF